VHLILYQKPGCHLCEGLQAKLELVRQPQIELEIRDITTQPEWFNAYQYEIPVLCQKLAEGEQSLPRLSPRASVAKLEQMLQKYLII
jgi:hypothetical protein